LHCCVSPYDFRLRSVPEIVCNELFCGLGIHFRIRCYPGKVEHGSGISRIFKVDQPEPLAVVQKICRQKIIVSEDDWQRHLCCLQALRDCHPFRNPCRHPAFARHKKPGIVADDMEWPEHEGRAGDMTRHGLVETAHDIGNPVCLAAHVRCRKGLRAEKLSNHQPGFRIPHLRTEARRMCCARDHHLPFPEDMVKRIIGADPDHVGAGRVGHLVAFVAEAALQRFDGNGALPARQGTDAIRQRRIHVQLVHSTRRQTASIDRARQDAR
jgi:hypothetical protein